MRVLSRETSQKVGEDVELSGWVDARRDHGKLIFIDLRDASGLVQLVFNAKNPDAYKIGETLRPEWVIRVHGTVSERPESMQNTDLQTGMVEVAVDKIEVLSEAQTPPFELGTDGYEVGEETRLKYRYLDLRRPRLAKNLRIRHKITKLARDFLDKEGFVEIETPLLTRSTPEGARDYLVPSRQNPGSFYALPQSPQQFKQLLMVAGFEKYFQLARALRDEDTRGDRQPEHTQLDMEMSFVTREEIMELNERLLISIVEELFPEKRIQEKPFPRIPYGEAMERWGTDRPDIREDKNDQSLLAFCWIIDFPFFEKAQESPSGWTFTHNPFSSPKDEFITSLDQADLPIEKIKKGAIKENDIIGGILATQYDIVLNGSEIGGGSIRNNNHENLLKVFKILGYDTKEAQNNFSTILTALQYGAPPHGGIAWGLDRLVSILQGEPNIREVIAFPKTGDGRDLMMEAPSEVDKDQLDELGLAINKKK